MKGRGEGLAAWHPIKPGGVLILGQEQVRHTDGRINTPMDGGINRQMGVQVNGKTAGWTDVWMDGEDEWTN